MIAFASLLIAASVGLFVWTITDVLWLKRTLESSEGRFEDERRVRLRQSNATYRRFEPLIDEWNRTWKIRDSKRDETEDALRAAGVREPWRPQDFLNAKRVEGFLVAAVLFLIAWMILDVSLSSALIVGIIGFFGYQWLMLRSLKSRATLRQLQMKRRFAGAIDLMALMMEVGAGFKECLDVAAEEAKGHPLGEELARVQKEIAMGALRSQSLQGLADRTRDPDMAEVILSINEGEQLGTPLTAILRNQADLMRQKRSQWAEKAAEESQVAIVFPAMLIMVACLLVIVAPFVLSVIFGESL